MRIPRMLRAVLRNILYWPATIAVTWKPSQLALAWLFSKLPYDGAPTARFFDLCQEQGWHITPVHFYQPVPDTRKLSDGLWKSRSEMVGVELNGDRQLQLLSEFSTSFAAEYNSFPDNKTACPWTFYYDQEAFRSNDPEILYSMIRKFRPKKVIEIGSGMSTLLSAAAIRKNEELHGHSCQLTAIEPFPNSVLKRGFPGLSEVLATPVEKVPLSRFTELGQNDILFIDSSHVVRIGGDVLYEYLEIIPRLTPGVLVHIHDVFSPAPYPKEWTMEKHLFWTEQYLLQAFLSFNAAFEVLWSGSYMHLNFPDRLEACFRAYNRTKEWPGSFWIRRKFEASP